MPIELTAKKAAQLEKVGQLASSLGVEVLAHFYQRAEVKAAAHFVGGSSEVAERAAQSRARAVMVCGACFMAEEILNRNIGRPLLQPREDLSCPLAEAVSLEEVLAIKKLNPEAVVVADMKARPEILALAEVKISPATAAEILDGLGSREVIALPGPQLVEWAGFGHLISARWPKAVCQVHELALKDDLAKAREEHPEAKVAVNLLCRPEVRAGADFVGDSAAIRNYCREANAREFIVVSEAGLAEYLAETLPDKLFHETEAEIFCPNMKLTTLKSMIDRLEKFGSELQPGNTPPGLR